jgi:Protein of unknown function (DUF2946)
MDDDVISAMQRWPNVPAAYGWLRLDRRGQWFLIEPGTHGSLVRNERLLDYIARNYEADAQGQWYFQNGPQRVFAQLELAPLVWRVDDSANSLKWVSQIGSVGLSTLEAAQDTLGNIYIRTELGTGVVDDRHMGKLVNWLIEAAQPNTASTLPSLSLKLAVNDAAAALPVLMQADPARHFGFIKDPIAKS